jgi:predicted O-methyltransferase YrrM
MVMKKDRLDVELIAPSAEENRVLDSLKDSYIKTSQMSDEDRRFLNSLIRRNKPQKLLEVGFHAGASSVVILNAISDINGAFLYSIDKGKKIEEKDKGYIVEEYPELKGKWKMFTGGFALNFIEEIGGKIDFCFIDTTHINPGEILDFLMVLPFLKENAVVVFHDTNLHTFRYPYGILSSPQWDIEWNSYAITTNLTISSIFGKKMICHDFVKRESCSKIYFANIAAVKLNNKTKNHLFELFNLLTIKWQYNIIGDERKSILSFFEKYYNAFYADYLKAVFDYHDICFQYEKTKKEEEKAKSGG